ncbi:unnamed protein product [Aphanomyces euteiches]
MSNEMSKNGEALIQAVRNGDLMQVRTLLDEGASPNAKGDRGETPLHWAATHGDSSIAAELLLRGADVDQLDSDGDTPLLAASNVGYFSVAKILLDHGASVDLNGKSALLQAHIKQNFQTVNLLLTHGASIPLEDSSDITPLHVASGAGHLETVDKVLAQSVNVDTKDIGSNTATSQIRMTIRWKKATACGFKRRLFGRRESVAGSWSCCRLNRQRQQDPPSDSEGRTSLIYAAYAGHVDIVKELLARGVSVDKAGEDGLTPLILASGLEHLEVVKVLLAHGATVDSGLADGKTPLMAASNVGHLDIVKVLLAHGENICCDILGWHDTLT